MTLEQQRAAEEAALAESRMTLGEHLNELRRRLFRGMLAIVVLFVAALSLNSYGDAHLVTEFAQRPYTDAMMRLEPEFIEKALAILETNPEREWSDFFFPGTEQKPLLRDFKRQLHPIGAVEWFIYELKICFYVALVLGSPVLLWQMWAFIAAGLYAKEKRAIVRYFPLSLTTFGAGILFGFLVIVPQALFYINQTVSVDLGIPTTTAGNYLSFLSSLCVAFGFIFQLPLVMTFLGSMGLVDHSTLAKYRGEFIVGAFVLSAFLTPPDPFTQMIMGVPMILLYEAGIIGARFAGKRHAAAAAAEQAALR